MTQETFLKESKSYIDSLYDEFKEYQSMVWDLFRFFNELCRKNDLHYYMGFGSLIGVVRDGGNIPWDYDIDVIIRIDDLDRLIQLLETKIPDNLYYVFLNNLHDYPTTCLRICKKGYPFTSIHLDVFLLIGNPDEEAESFVKQIDYFHSLREIKYGDKWYPRGSRESRGDKIVAKLREIRKDLISDRKIVQFEKGAFKKYNLASSKNCSIVGDPYLHVYQTSDFESTQDVTINGVPVSIPNGYDRYLKTIYKDYMTYLPIDKRYEEFYTMTKTVRERNQFMADDRTGVFDFCR